MIARVWKGIVKAHNEEHYINHLQGETFPGLKKIDGFISATVLKRQVAGGTEFMVTTTWNSLETIRQFAGTDLDHAVVPVIAQQMMVSYDDYVSHYEIALEFNPDI
jgi:heme-degrading monooxygenase HmoA